MRLSQRIFFIVFPLAFALGFAGCQQEWSAEKAGRMIDQAAKKAGEKTEEARKALSVAARQPSVSGSPTAQPAHAQWQLQV